MAVTPQERTSLITLVVGMFNAAPGAIYLADVTTIYEANGRSLQNLAIALGNSAAFKSVTPAFRTAADFVGCFLPTIGLQNNAIAVDFVTSQFNAGVAPGQIMYTALAALDATNLSEFQNAKNILYNKTVVAEYYSVTKAIGQTSIYELQKVLGNVDANPASVNNAKDLIDHPVGINTSMPLIDNFASAHDLHSASSSSTGGSENIWHYSSAIHAEVMPAMTGTIDVVGLHPLG